jgi:hypothetical protein
MKGMSLVAMLLLIAGCTDLADPQNPRRLSPRDPLNQQLANQTVPTGVVTTNPCNDDVVPLVGSTHTVLTSTQSSSGNFRNDLDVSSRWEGVGTPSGLKYVGSETYHDTFLLANPLPFETTFYQEFDVISQTSADNYRLRLQFHITVNANGVVTADVSNPSSTCTG